MDLKSSYQKLVTKVTDLENEKAELLSEVEQLRLLSKFKKTDFAKERDEFQAEISELQMLVEDLRTQVENNWLRKLKKIVFVNPPLFRELSFFPLMGCTSFMKILKLETILLVRPLSSVESNGSLFLRKPPCFLVLNLLGG